MKKLILSVALTAVATVASFGQGFFIFQNSAATAVWEHFSGANWVKGSGNLYVSLLFSTDTNAVPLVGTSSSPTNSDTSGDWTKIMTDPNFHFAQRTGTNLLAPTGSSFAAGTFNGGTVGIDGTSANQVIKMYAIAWRQSDGGQTPNVSGFVGWSNPFIFALGSSGVPAPSLPTDGMTGFGVQPVPEPSTFALAGLGAAAMLILRRRK